MLSEIPAFGPFKKKSRSDIPKSEKPFSEMSVDERKRAMREKLREPGYKETTVGSGKDIIEGGSEETYNVFEKAGFLDAWSQDLSELATGIPDIGRGRVGNAAYGTTAGLFVEWDADGVRPVWVKQTSGKGPGETEEERDTLTIAENFPFPVIEGAFDNAKAELERLKRTSV